MVFHLLLGQVILFLVLIIEWVVDATCAGAWRELAAFLVEMFLRHGAEPVYVDTRAFMSS